MNTAQVRKLRQEHPQFLQYGSTTGMFQFTLKVSEPYQVKNPVLPHGASSKEKAILAIRPLPLGRAPALPSGPFWLLHVNPSAVESTATEMNAGDQ